MRRFLHMWWPVAAIVLFTVTLVLEIPRKALFFQPVAVSTAEPFVSFISLDDESYARLVRRISMAWQIRGRALAGGVADSRTDAFDFSVPLPPPTYLPLRAVASRAAVPRAAAQSAPSLLPPTLGVETPPVPAAAALPDRDPALLEMPEAQALERPHADFTLKRTRSIK